MTALKESEHDITRAIRDYLNLKGIWHYKHWQGGMQGKRGISDIIGIYGGRFLAIEVKTEKGKLSERQAQFIAEVRTAGGIAFVARSIDDVMRGLVKAEDNQEVNHV